MVGGFEVTQRAAGANMSVDISLGYATILGDAISGQGMYIAFDDGATNEAITAAHATLPRVDQVILEVQDNLHDASGANASRLRVVDGVATAGATLDNRNGAAALPNSAIRLADVLVAATDTAISNGEIRDRRKWSRGAFSVITRNTGGPLARTSSTLAEMDSTNIKPRIECSGTFLRCTLECDVQAATADKIAAFDLFIDGVAQNLQRRAHVSVAASSGRANVEWYVMPSEGSHRIAPGFASVDNVTSISVLTSATEPLTFTVEEDVRTSAANNTTTSG